METFFNIMNVFTVTFIKCNALMLNNGIHLLPPCQCEELLAKTSRNVD